MLGIPISIGILLFSHEDLKEQVSSPYVVEPGLEFWGIQVAPALRVAVGFY